MIKVDKKKSKLRLALILGSAILVAIAASIALFLIFGNREAEKPEPDVPEILDGEDLYNNIAIAYPKIDDKNLQLLSVSTPDNSFRLIRDDGELVLFYKNGDGEYKAYYPKICEEDVAFSYSDLYALETGDGFGTITKLSYLSSAVRLTYFEERIELPKSDPEMKEKMLAEYGLSEGKYTTIYFEYENKDKKTEHHTIKLGAKMPSGNGYYFRVDDRDFVYGGRSNQFDYALAGFFSFINPMLVSPGLEEDSVYSAFITADYKQWKNKVHNSGEVPSGSSVIVFSDILTPLGESTKTSTEDGYTKEGYEEFAVNLFDYINPDGSVKAGCEGLVSSLVGKETGSYTGKDEIFFTLTGEKLRVDLSDKSERVYEYSIKKIESVISCGIENATQGAPVLGAEYVKIAYTLKTDGKAVTYKNESGEELPRVLHAVIDLSDKTLPDQLRSELSAASVGDISGSPIEYTHTYTKDSAEKKEIKYVITELLSIYSQTGKVLERVTKDSVITYRYRFLVNGEYLEGEHTVPLDLGKDTSAEGAIVREKLLGKKVSRSLAIVISESTEYCQPLYDFMSYRVSEIRYFVTRELVSSFRFWNKSERDPFYGESIYENTMTNEYSLYGINSNVCQAVSHILSGIAEATTATDGLVGIETVALGLSPKVLLDNGLYAHTVYFEVPRGILSVPSGDEGLDDYDWYTSVGFTLYISDEREDGTRLVASDLFDLVAKVDGADFVFLKHNFIDFWARRALVMTDISSVEKFEMDFYFDDFVGSYDFDLDHKTIYIGSDNKGYPYPPDGLGISYTPFDEITVSVTPSGECTPNKLTEYVKNNTESGFVSLTELYNKTYGKNPGDKLYEGRDPMGTSYFKDFIKMLYYVSYEGSVSKTEQAGIVANSPKVMSFSIKLDSDAYKYVYEFYRFDENRVLVRIVKTDFAGVELTPVSDFYISSFAMKKIANNMRGILNAEKITPDEGYAD